MHINPEDHIQYWINHLSFLLRRDVQRRFLAAGHKISAEEWAILLMLWQENGRTPGELATVTVKDQTTVTRLLDGMSRKGLVDRLADKQDRRKVRISLTPKARSLQNELLPIAAELMAESQDGLLPDDVNTAMRVMRKMAANMRKGKSE